MLKNGSRPADHPITQERLPVIAGWEVEGLDGLPDEIRIPVRQIVRRVLQKVNQNGVVRFVTDDGNGWIALNVLKVTCESLCIPFRLDDHEITIINKCVEVHSSC